MVEFQLFTMFFNYFSLERQGAYKYWEAAGFLFCMRDKSSVQLPYSIIMQPLILFNAMKTVLYQ